MVAQQAVAADLVTERRPSFGRPLWATVDSGVHGLVALLVTAPILQDLQHRCATWLYHGRISSPLMDRGPPHSAGRHPHRPQDPRRRALRTLEKLPSGPLVPQAAERADSDAGGPQAPSADEGWGAHRRRVRCGS